MAEAIVFILIFLAVIAIAALAFGAWLLVATISIGWSLVRWIFGKHRQTPLITALPRQGTLPANFEPAICGNRLCVAQNPPGAQFCRRCGRRQARPILVPVRRAAVW